MNEGLDRIVELHQAGRLAAQYRSVRDCLRGLDDAQLQRAGRLLAQLDPDDVVRHDPDIPAITVAITGHGTLAPLIPALTAEFARHGLLLRAHAGDFDGYIAELSDTGSQLYAADPDLVLCLLDPAVVSDELPAAWRVEDVERALTEKVRMLEQLSARFAGLARGTLVLNTLPLPWRLAAQLTDYRSRARLGAAWRTAGTELLRLCETRESVVTLDLDPLVSEGIPVTDPRLSVYAGLHWSPELLAKYAREIGHLARHLTGRTKKCLVVDLDNTLWGGTLGDDGLDGIDVGESLRGRAFTAVQRTVKQLAAQGVLLAAVSKNDAGIVREALTCHPEMTLREEDFVRVIANWGPKHDNLSELAKDLNLGVDAMVFADDSPFERGLVQQELPDIDVVPLDDEPGLHVERLLADGWFTVNQLTAEDRARPARYREDLARRDFLDASGTPEQYLAGLDVRVLLEPVREQQVPRVSQITLRTNQFNMTTRRLQPADVTALAAGAVTTVLAISSRDRFGDNGLVGAIFLRRDGDLLQVENFLLSCRVFSRGIEHACLLAVLRHAVATGAGAVHGAYRPTAKNAKVRDFYRRNGFLLAGPGEGEVLEFRHDLGTIAASPPHVLLDSRLEGRTP